MKKKLLPLAMLAGLAGAAGTAQAVHVNSDGLGETLIYPYYTVENGQNTLVHVTNTTDQYKAVKVRFIEAENSAEVLDFNLYLSPHDVWTGTIVPEGEGAKLITRDNSCTAPWIPRPDADGNGQDGQVFVDYEYRSDGGTTGLARTREGYVEIIEMGVIANAGTGMTVDGVNDYNPAADIRHSPSGIPGNCDRIRSHWETAGTPILTGLEGDVRNGTGFWTGDPSEGFAGSTETTNLLGGLYGYGVIINPAEGSAAGYNAVALDGFWNQEFEFFGEHTNPGTTSPSLGDAGALATVFNSITATTYETIDGWDAVSAVLMHDTVANDFMLDEFVAGDTDWVLAMPTKREYVNSVRPPVSTTDPDPITQGDDGSTPWNDTQARPPFTTSWTGTACEELDLRSWDREEAVTVTTGGLQFSPRPPADEGPEAFAICKEVSVISFGDGTALYPSERVQYGVSNLINHDNGWARLDFTNYTSGNSTLTRYMVVGEGAEPAFPHVTTNRYLVGLPVIGFAVQKYINGAMEAGVLANYAALVQHNYTRRVDEAEPGNFDTRYPGLITP